MNQQADTGNQRLAIRLHGAVQGVGFRPFVYRLATSLELHGWVLNSSSGLQVEVEGPLERLREFVARLESERPVAAVVLRKETAWLEPAGYTDFEIRESDDEQERTAGLLPDLATCAACRAELFDPANRRHNYPFTNCTNCGPRYTIILDIPYDRPNTTMAGFPQCPACLGEYTDPRDRRFHAQPNACPVCGPHLEGGTIAEAAVALRAGEILALKGIGGFQLLVDATNFDAVAALRTKKHREAKPFALMMPSIETARRYCEVSPDEQQLLKSPAAPIVLLKPNGGSGYDPGIAANVAPGSAWLGVMLPYSPLHHLLMAECPFPVVATSGNRSEEPIAIGNQEAATRLGGIATRFLMHNRPVARPCDDSVVRVARGREAVMRRARGYAPLPLRVGRDLPAVLAVGGHLKSTVAIAVGRQVCLSQHIGDLESLEAREAFVRAIEDLCHLYRFQPEMVVCDLHPDYYSTQWARASGLPAVAVQHHHAHAVSCAAENEIDGPYLAAIWDGAGYGLDGTVWGGEFFLVDGKTFQRVAHLRPFRLPGGEAAMREGWRSAASLLWETFGAENINPILPIPPMIPKMLERKINSPVTTSMGRLFDAVAALSGAARENRFEGQAAMMLERTAMAVETDQAYPLPGGDWEPLVRGIVQDVRASVPLAEIAARFHNALVAWIEEVAIQYGVKQLALSGGVFQNRLLVERAVERLEARGFTVYTHRRVPPNDGGLALGQAVLANSGSA
jgi:hydrogenase maturation protein HypF